MKRLRERRTSWTGFRKGKEKQMETQKAKLRAWPNRQRKWKIKEESKRKLKEWQSRLGWSPLSKVWGKLCWYIWVCVGIHVCCDACNRWYNVECTIIRRKRIPDMFYCEDCYLWLIYGTLTHNVFVGLGIFIGSEKCIRLQFWRILLSGNKSCYIFVTHNYYTYSSLYHIPVPGIYCAWYLVFSSTTFYSTILCVLSLHPPVSAMSSCKNIQALRDYWMNHYGQSSFVGEHLYINASMHMASSWVNT